MTLAVGAALPPARLAGQQVTVSISPPDGNTYASGPLSVTITWCAVGAALDETTKTVTLNGQSVTGNFGWSPGTQGGCDSYATSVGSVTLGPGTNTLYAQVGASYTPPPPPPECPPFCDQKPVPPGPSADFERFESPDTEYVYGSATAQWGTSAPIVSLAPHNPWVLPGSSDVTFAHSTPAYFSLGQARSVSLAYHSSRVRPTPVILFDVSNPAWSSPTWYSVQVRRASNGSLLTLLNNSTTVYYTPAGTTPLRLAAALDADTNQLGTGWHDLTLTVTARVGAGTQATTVPVRLLVVDRSGSAFGKGLDLLGLPRIHAMLGSNSFSVLVAEGDGRAEFFETFGNCETCSFVTPPGEASSLSKVSDPVFGLMYRRRYPDGAIMDFASDGQARRAVGRFGDTTLFIWTDTLLTQIRDPMGKTLILAYSGGKLQSVTDPAGRATTYSIDSSGRLFRITDPDTIATNLAYDATNLLMSVTDRGGSVTTFTYDALRRVDTTYAPTIQIHTGASTRPRTVVTAPERIVWQPSTAGTDTLNKKLAVRPDTLFTVVVAPNGAVSKVSQDRFGSPTKVIGPYGQITTITRDTLGRALVTTAPNGQVTRQSYGNGFIAGLYAVTQVKDSTTGRTISYSYTATAVGAVIDKMHGDVTRLDMVYHNGDRGPVGAIDTVYGVTRTVLVSTHLPDALGRDTLVADGGQHRTRIAYETVWGNVREKISPRGSVTRFHYDAAGRVDSAWVPESGLITYQYDLLNRQTQVKNALGHIVRYVYGPTTLNRVIDPRGQVYKFAYNPMGMLIARHDLGDTLKADTLKYDEAGNVRTVRTRRGDAITMTYDLERRLVSRSGPDFPVDSFKYDPGGRWTVAWNANQRDSSAFDQAGRLAATRQAMLGGVAYQLTYTYDIRDRLTNRSAPTGGNVTKYVYNAAQGVLDTLCAAAACVAFRRNVELLRDTITYNPGQGGSWKRFRYYDSTHAVVRDTFNLVGLDTLFGGRWIYDSLSRLKWEDSSAAGTRQRRYYEYDALGRLVDACDEHIDIIIGQGTYPSCGNEYGGTSGPPYMGGGPKPYAYDSSGNRVDPAASATIGSGNRVVAFRGYTLGYDASGSIVSKTGPGAAYTYTWDALGRLIEVRNGGNLIASYKYDALGRRVSGTAPDGTTERYVYDRDHVILDVNGAHALKGEYGYNPGVDQLFAVKNTQTAAWTGVALTDPMVGTVRGIANLSGGALRKKYQVTAWGQGTADTGVVTRLRMAGREYDQVTKLYHMRARYYDPELGRFLSEDPIGIAGGLNLYTYAGNDPVNSRDPTGLCKDPGGKEAESSAPAPAPSAASSGDGDKGDGGDDCDDNDDSNDGPFETWDDVWAWIDWAWAQPYDFVAWSQGTVYESNVYTLYAHLSLTMVDEFDYVRQDEVIGFVGRTGRVTGPHLHFELRVNGRSIDPYSPQQYSMMYNLFSDPLDDMSRVTDDYGWREAHPVTGERSFHDGIDIAASVGTPVHAAGSGLVVLSGAYGNYGNTVVIWHFDR